jgi:hypothetical protein
MTSVDGRIQFAFLSTVSSLTNTPPRAAKRITSYAPCRTDGSKIGAIDATSKARGLLADVVVSDPTLWQH